MRILAIETSTGRGSVALLKQETLVREAVLPAHQRTALSLAPTMADLLQQAAWSPGSVELVAVTSGPGSFTGLRIAVTAAKTFAYAAQAQVVAVNTLRVIVGQLPATVTEACALVNAHRGQLFAGQYHRGAEHRWVASTQCRVVDREALAGLLSPDTVLTGPFLARCSPTFLEGHARAIPDCWTPRAATVGRLAQQAYAAGQRDDVFKLQPQYYRASYAERNEP